MFGEEEEEEGEGKGELKGEGVTEMIERERHGNNDSGVFEQ